MKKIKIADKLQDFVAKGQVNKILRRIDGRQGLRPSPQDIVKEVHTYRQQKLKS